MSFVRPNGVPVYTETGLSAHPLMVTSWWVVGFHLLIVVSYVTADRSLDGSVATDCKLLILLDL